MNRETVERLHAQVSEVASSLTALLAAAHGTEEADLRRRVWTLGRNAVIAADAHFDGRAEALEFVDMANAEGRRRWGRGEGGDITAHGYVLNLARHIRAAESPDDIPPRCLAAVREAMKFLKTERLVALRLLAQGPVTAPEPEQPAAKTTRRKRQADREDEQRSVVEGVVKEFPTASRNHIGKMVRKKISIGRDRLLKVLDELNDAGIYRGPQ